MHALELLKDSEPPASLHYAAVSSAKRSRSPGVLLAVA